MKLLMFIVLTLLIWGSPAKSQSCIEQTEFLKLQAAALKAATTFAEDICKSINTTVNMKTIEASAEIKAKLAGVAKNLVDLGAEASTKYSSQQGELTVLQKDLAEALAKTQNCRQDTVKLVIDRMLPPRPYCAPPKKQHKVMFQGDGLFIDNTDIGDVWANTSTIEFRLNGEYAADMTLSQPFDGFTELLPEGDHFFVYKADIRAKSGIKIRDTCTVKFTVKADALFLTSLSLAAVDGVKGRISSCRLKRA